MKTVDIRVLLPDEVDEGYFLQQLVGNSRGPGAPLAAVKIELTGFSHEDNVELEPTGCVFTRVTAAALWKGQEVYPENGLSSS